MKKIVFVGDCNYNTGPSNVNKDYKKCLLKKVYFLRNSNKILRIFETLIAVLSADAVIISGLSYINIFALYISKMKRIPNIYIMHGCYEYESFINNMKKNKIALFIEKKMLQLTKRIVAVSEFYANWLKEYFPQYKNKIVFVNNGIDWSRFELKKNGARSKKYILATGGGIPQKNNINVCKAIELLNSKYNLNFEFVVLGQDHIDTFEIKRSPYTNYIGQITHKEAQEWMKKSYLYIQNSYLDSFGLAPIEALCLGCNLLMSKGVGASSIMNSLQEKDIIKDCNDIEEIATKILCVCEEENNARLLSGIDVNTSSCDFSSEKLLEIIESIDE